MDGHQSTQTERRRWSAASCRVIHCRPVLGEKALNQALTACQHWFPYKLLCCEAKDLLRSGRRWHVHTQSCLLTSFWCEAQTSVETSTPALYPTVSSCMSLHTSAQHRLWLIWFVCVPSWNLGPETVSQRDGMSASYPPPSSIALRPPGSPLVWSLPPLQNHIPPCTCPCTAQSGRADGLTQSQQVDTQKDRDIIGRTDHETEAAGPHGNSEPMCALLGYNQKKPAAAQLSEHLENTPLTPLHPAVLEFHGMIVLYFLNAKWCFVAET